jgi:hypothetical protein
MPSTPALQDLIYFLGKASSLALPISILFSASYTFSLLPADWKTAIVQPFFKKNDPSLVSNFRPISSLYSRLWIQS